MKIWGTVFEENKLGDEAFNNQDYELAYQKYSYVYKNLLEDKAKSAAIAFEKQQRDMANKLESEGKYEEAITVYEEFEKSGMPISADKNDRSIKTYGEIRRKIEALKEQVQLVEMITPALEGDYSSTFEWLEKVVNDYYKDPLYNYFKAKKSIASLDSAAAKYFLYRIDPQYEGMLKDEVLALKELYIPRSDWNKLYYQYIEEVYPPEVRKHLPEPRKSMSKEEVLYGTNLGKPTEKRVDEEDFVEKWIYRNKDGNVYIEFSSLGDVQQILFSS
ncbi:hypothetical protein [Paenibacillus agilis]|uniref:Tetratricopeptide repeat protein n=1 Tax=Paenibacillus agilis TaxID=3020863 RepID=A0A559J2I0_9BACL|nr:hypothetical protein [Paenibacillus agilis]TVX94085.1 hypothetical protein FPZ44_14095 [Paenibacillus agilis]